MNKRYFGLISVGLVLGMAAPATAAPRSTDPVESASATLSETLAAHRAEQHQLMQMQAKRYALFREGAFLMNIPFDKLRVTGVSPALSWLIGQGDPAVTGFQPVSGRVGLLVSYQIPTTDPLAFLRGRSWTYDNAAGAIALLFRGQPDAARRVLSTLQGLMAPDGSLGFSYQVDSSFVDGRARTGTLTWVGYAMALYQRQTGDSSFQASAEKIGSYLKNLQTASGSIKGGPDVSWVSTTQIKNSLLANHWTGSVSKGHFLQGIGDPTPALDANSWGALFLSAIGRSTQAKQALKYVEATFKNTKQIAGTSTNLTGYSPDAAKKTVWLEGTAGVAAAYQRVGQTQKAGSIMSGFSAWTGGIPYSMPRYINSDGDTFSDLLSVPSTAWHQIALSVRAGSSLF